MEWRHAGHMFFTLFLRLTDSIDAGELLAYDSYVLGAHTESTNETAPAEPAKKKRKVETRRTGKKLTVALAEDTDESILLPILKQMNANVCDVTPRLMNGQLLSVLVSGGSRHTGEWAVATVCNIPVVSEAWLYASLENGEFLPFDQYELNTKALCSREEPFDGLSIFIHGKVGHVVGKPGVHFIIKKGGGQPCEINLEEADLQVVFDTNRGAVPQLPAVTPDWLFDSAESHKRLPLQVCFSCARHICQQTLQIQKFLLPTPEDPVDDGVSIDDSDLAI